MRYESGHYHRWRSQPFAPVGCNLGGVLCPGGGAGGGGASPGGASARTLWAVEFARRVLWLPVVDVFRGSEGGGFSHYWVPMRYTVWSAARVKAGVDRQPADERLRTRSPYLRAFVSAARAWTIWKNTSVEKLYPGTPYIQRVATPPP